MASLKKRGSTYYAQYYVNGKQERANLHTASKQIAKEGLRKIESALLYQTEIPLPTKTPLSKVIEDYLAARRAHSGEVNTQKVITYLRSMFGHITPSLKYKNPKIARQRSENVEPIFIKYVEQLHPKLISRFIREMRQENGISEKTANHYRVNILSLCNWAKAEGGVNFPGGHNPAQAVKIYKEGDRDITYLELHEIAEQLEVLAGNVQLQTMVALYIYGGLRREEALWIMPSDIDWNAGKFGTIRLRDKTWNGKKWLPKTKVNRTVPINSTLRGYLDKYLQEIQPKVWFFETPEGCRFHPDNFSRSLRKANKAAGLSWSCLDYRHTFGSQLAMKGESLYKISKLMGNGPEICRKHYAHLSPACLEDAVEFPEPQGSIATVPESAPVTLSVPVPEPAPASVQPGVPQADAEPVAEGTVVRPWLRLVVNNA